jgi:hypothetical protein
LSAGQACLVQQAPRVSAKVTAIRVRTCFMNDGVSLTCVWFVLIPATWPGCRTMCSRRRREASSHLWLI